MSKTTTTKTRTRSPAVTYQVPQTREACAKAIAELGLMQRELNRVGLELNDQITRLTEEHQPQIDDLTRRIDAIRQGIQTWCEANRSDLLGPGDDRGKTANLVTGEVSWRNRPPSVAVRGMDAVIETLRRLGLTRFIRITEAVNREAILNEPTACAAVPGLTVVRGVEDFIVTPFEVSLEN